MKKVLFSIGYSIISLFWLFISVLFTSALWLEKTDSKDWSEDAMFIPIGIVMLIIWIISLIAFVHRIKK